MTVNTTSDHAPDGACNTSPDCTLREAITYAPVGDTIVFASGLSGGTITLASTLTLSMNGTIDGTGLATPITIDGN